MVVKLHGICSLIDKILKSMVPYFLKNGFHNYQYGVVYFNESYNRLSFTVKKEEYGFLYREWEYLMIDHKWVLSEKHLIMPR